MFKPNDSVLCVDTRPCPRTKLRPTYLKEGTTYTVSDLSVCCMTRISLKEIPESREILKGFNCVCGHEGFGYYTWRFIKIAGDDIPVEDTTPSEEELELREYIYKEVEKIV